MPITLWCTTAFQALHTSSHVFIGPWSGRGAPPPAQDIATRYDSRYGPSLHASVVDGQGCGRDKVCVCCTDISKVASPAVSPASVPLLLCVGCPARVLPSRAAHLSRLWAVQFAPCTCTRPLLTPDACGDHCRLLCCFVLRAALVLASPCNTTNIHRLDPLKSPQAPPPPPSQSPQAAA